MCLCVVVCSFVRSFDRLCVVGGCAWFARLRVWLFVRLTIVVCDLIVFMCGCGSLVCCGHLFVCVFVCLIRFVCVYFFELCCLFGCVRFVCLYVDVCVFVCLLAYFVDCQSALFCCSFVWLFVCLFV